MLAVFSEAREVKISVPKESLDGENRVAVIPAGVKQLAESGFSVAVQSGAGVSASFADDDYAAAGADVVTDTAAWEGDLVIKINKPTQAEIAKLRDGSALIALLQPLTNRELVQQLANRGVTSFSLDALPRISRAQSMDVLSSMSTIAGYKAVLLAAVELGKFLPMLMTAAGTIAPAKVFILGAGVAGLQAIATAKRLGAVVSAFDVRSAVKEQVESLGAEFVAAEELSGESEDAGGYAKELSEDQHAKELALIQEHSAKSDIIISTALIPGKPAPLLLTKDAISGMRPGSVIIDLAADAGGNCELTRAGETVEHGGVRILGPINLPSSVPLHASQMFSRNVLTFVKHLAPEGELVLDFEDEITRGTCITHRSKVVHEVTLKAYGGDSRQ